MKFGITLIIIISSSILLKAQLSVVEIGVLPEPVSNNAVCEGFIDNVPYLYSFGGIDTSKQYSGIHLRSFRVNLQSGESVRIPDLPDTLGKIASAASRINDIIYISGGYHVLSEGSEITSGKMHRYDIVNNVFLSDAADIPKPTDDHVQVVWRDSLIYLITGWSTNRNIFNVQIYNPSDDTWIAGSSLPNNSSYKSFGASGAIVGDTIYYFGGATSDQGFGIQNQLRKGVINPDNPTVIEWSFSVPDPDINGYRMASTVVNNELHWIGGSLNTYNYDGIAYDGSGGVPPSNRDLYTDPSDIAWNEEFVAQLPMDLRGIAKITDTMQFVAGGMLNNQMVSDKIFMLEWQSHTSSITSAQADIDAIEVFPNPFDDHVSIQVTLDGFSPTNVDLYHSNGQLVLSNIWIGDVLYLKTDTLPDGAYVIKVYNDNTSYLKNVIKHNNR